MSQTFHGPRLTLPEIAVHVAAIYETHSAGCCLHIVLDDGNVENSSVEHCIEWAREAAHKRCEELAIMLRSMTKTQRLKAFAHARDADSAAVRRMLAEIRGEPDPWAELESALDAIPPGAGIRDSLGLRRARL